MTYEAYGEGREKASRPDKMNECSGYCSAALSFKDLRPGQLGMALVIRTRISSS